MSFEAKDGIGEEGQSVPGSAGGPNSTGNDLLNLTALDKIKRFFFSKEEWEAYLMEKLEEEKKRKGLQKIRFSRHFLCDFGLF